MAISITEERVVLGPESAGLLLTPEEFDAIEEYDDEYSYELIHGVVVVTPIPSEGEVDPNEELGHLLRTYAESHPKGSALDATLPERYINTATSRRKADRVIWCGLGRMPNPKRDIPRIAVEFVSRGRRNRKRDYEDKRDEYLEAGVSEYWVIDRFQRSMTVFTASGKRVILESRIYKTRLLPGFELPLSRLFRAADAWK